MFHSLVGIADEYILKALIGAIFGLILTKIFMKDGNTNMYVASRDNITNYNVTINKFIIENRGAQNQDAIAYIITFVFAIFYLHYATIIINVSIVICFFILMLSIINIFYITKYKFNLNYSIINCIISIILQVALILILNTIYSNYILYILNTNNEEIYLVKHSLEYFAWLITQVCALFLSLISMYMCLMKMINLLLLMSQLNTTSHIKSFIFRLTYTRVPFTLFFAAISSSISFFMANGQIYDYIISK